MDLGLRGKVAIVTGGSKGIGSGCAQVLAEEGCHVVVVYRSDPEGSEAFVQSLRDLGTDSIGICADITQDGMVDYVYDTVIQRLGPVDILINNANGGQPRGKSFDTVTMEEWRRGFEGTLHHAFAMSKRFVQECRREKRGGHIVNVLAKAALMTNSTNNTTYIAAKGALTTMTRGLANEVIGDGIYVNGIVPGYVQTRVYPPGASHTVYKEQFLRVGWAQPRDMGAVAAFLCSPVACQVIGAVVDCSGGTML